MNRLVCLLVLLVAVMLAGCSSIMRPPSAAAFMSSYEKDAAVVNMSLALYGGDLDNNDKHYNHHKDMSESHSEWVLDFSEIVFLNKELLHPNTKILYFCRNLCKNKHVTNIRGMKNADF